MCNSIMSITLIQLDGGEADEEGEECHPLHRLECLTVLFPLVHLLPELQIEFHALQLELKQVAD